MKLVHKLHHFVLSDHFAINANALAKVDKVWRGEQPHAVAVELEHGSKHMRHRALTIGTSHMNDAVVAVGMSEQPVQVLAGLQSGLIATSALPFEGWTLVVEVVDGFLIIHNSYILYNA